MFRIHYLVGSKTSNDTSEKGTAGTKTGDQFLVVCGLSVVVEISAEVNQDGRDDTSVVTEQTTSDGCSKGDEPDIPTRLDVLNGVVVEIVGENLLNVINMSFVGKDHVQVGLLKTTASSHG